VDYYPPIVITNVSNGEESKNVKCEGSTTDDNTVECAMDCGNESNMSAVDWAGPVVQVVFSDANMASSPISGNASAPIALPTGPSTTPYAGDEGTGTFTASGQWVPPTLPPSAQIPGNATNVTASSGTASLLA